MVCLMEYF